VLVNPPFDVPCGTYFWESARLTRLDALDVSGAHVVVRRCTRTPDARLHREAHADTGEAFVARIIARLDFADAHGRDERVCQGAWAAMVSRRVPLFDDHRACVAKAAAHGLERALVDVPASAANRARHMPLLYDLALDGGGAIACTEAELFALAGRARPPK
jgi:hypothetical protein